MKAKKSLGQHFLTQPEIAQRIADALSGEGYDQIIEVGPGKGILTRSLLKRSFRITAVELDQDMLPYLESILGNHRLIHNNFLRLPLLEIMDHKPFAIIGNFPYNISSQIVFKMLDCHELVPELVGMFQKEMAERILAAPGSKDYGVISVLTQFYYDGEWIMTVKPGSFSPPPKVMSGVIRLKRKKEQIGNLDYQLYRRVVKTAFGQRRKMMKNTLKSFFPADWLAEDPVFKMRPEQISVIEFSEMTKTLAAKLKSLKEEE